MPFIEAYSEPGAAISASGQKVSVITFNGVKRAFVEVSGIGPQGPKGDGFDFYSKVLPAGTSITIPKSEHGLDSVRGLTALAENNQVAEVLMEIQPDMDVVIQTNLSFENYKITIF